MVTEMTSLMFTGELVVVSLLIMLGLVAVYSMSLKYASSIPARVKPVIDVVSLVILSAMAMSNGIVADNSIIVDAQASVMALTAIFSSTSVGIVVVILSSCLRYFVFDHSLVWVGVALIILNYGIPHVFRSQLKTDCDSIVLAILMAIINLVVISIGTGILGMSTITAEHLLASVMVDIISIPLVLRLVRSEIKRLENNALLRRDARYDGLTGLSNRQTMNRRVCKTILTKPTGSHALMFIDLDHFKNINDTLGHLVGDELLKMVANRLTICAASPNITVSRTGGDEFIAFLDNATDRQVEQFATDVIASINAPFYIGDREAFVGASIGIAHYPTDGQDAKTLMTHADTALYQAKTRGRNLHIHFHQTMDEKIQRYVTIENYLRYAVTNNDFRLNLQPIVDMRYNKLLGGEALLRWNGDLGDVTTQELIEVAEQSGMIVHIGEWVLHQAVRYLEVWNQMGYDLKLSVNVSARQFKCNFIKTIDTVLAANITPDQLQLEVTETVLFDDYTQAEHLIEYIRNKGIDVVLDDFGTGYSSLNYLRRFKVNGLKIDQSFIRDIDQQAETPQLIDGIITIADALHLDTTAEGIETEEQRDFLVANKCHKGQGYFYGRPMCPRDFLDFLRHIHGDEDALAAWSLR